jgi:hypothetical protein
LQQRAVVEERFDVVGFSTSPKCTLRALVRMNTQAQITPEYT